MPHFHLPDNNNKICTKYLDWLTATLLPINWPSAKGEAITTNSSSSSLLLLFDASLPPLDEGLSGDRFCALVLGRRLLALPGAEWAAGEEGVNSR
jgi:hypothetical protein